MGIKKQGYTIVESMIVIAVTALIFVATVTAFSGRQQDIQFSQSVRDFDSQIQDIISDVSTGFFENPGGIACGLVSGEIQITQDATSDAGQGANEDCIFVGKALEFAPADAPDSINIYTLLGKRTNDGANSTDITAAAPKAIGFEENVRSYQLDWGTQITRVATYDGTTVTDYGTVAFVTSFNTLNTSVNYGAVAGTDLGVSPLSELNALTTTSGIPGSPGEINLSGEQQITVCMQSPSGDKGAIIIGGGGSVATQLAIDSYDPEICDA